MNESTGAQYALQVALQTMKERRQLLEKRVQELEEENVSLKRKYSNSEGFNSLNEIDKLKAKVAELTTEKSQLRQKIQMVTTENKQLWSRLYKLSEDNKSLDLNLTKINDKLTQHTTGHSPLIRSKTFTQEMPQTKHLQRTLLENDKISLELEDISLKLISSISKEKSELESQCTEMLQLQNNEILTSFGFNFEDEDEDSIQDDMEQYINELKKIKNGLLIEKEKLIKNVQNLQIVKANVDKQTETETAIPEEEMDLDSLVKLSTPIVPDDALICPLCSVKYKTDTDSFVEFQYHVESHFRLEAGLEVVP